MIGLGHFQMQSPLQAVLPELCLKATPDSEFISILYGFDMSLCPHWHRSPWAYISLTQTFTELFDAINSSSRVPELVIWMKSQVCLTIIVLFIFNDIHCTSIETP